MRKTRAAFIVLEGLDGSGTTTQAGHLTEWLADRKLAVESTFEPTDGAVGRLIREALAGPAGSAGAGSRAVFSEDALCLLFAADRIEHSREIRAWLSAGRHVVCDRYVHSSIAYQSLDPAIPAERVVEANRGIAVPDITIFLDVPVEQCLARLKDREASPSVYEKKDILGRIHDNYLATASLYEEHFGPIHTVDGNRPAAEVTASITSIVGKFLEDR